MYGTPQWYLLMRAANRFHSSYKRLPGDKTTDLESDIPLLKKVLQDVCGEINIPSTILSDEMVHEMCRFGGAELHSVAATMGGLAAQEIIKLLTHQLVPLEHSYVYNGLTCTAASFSI